MTEPLTTIALLKQIKDNLPQTQSEWSKVDLAAEGADYPLLHD